MVRRHFHVVGRGNGYLPDHSEVFETRRDAVECLRDYLEVIEDECDDEHRGKCFNGKASDGYVDFKDGHDVWEAEIIECYKEYCLDDW